MCDPGAEAQSLDYDEIGLVSKGVAGWYQSAYQEAVGSSIYLIWCVHDPVLPTLNS